MQKLYLHVCNSGATVKVSQEKYGIKLSIGIGAFDALKAETSVRLNREGLKALADFFNKAVAEPFEDVEDAIVAKPLKPYGNPEDTITDSNGSLEDTKVLSIVRESSK